MTAPTISTESCWLVSLETDSDGRKFITEPETGENLFIPRLSERSPNFKVEAPGVVPADISTIKRPTIGHPTRLTLAEEVALTQ